MASLGPPHQPRLLGTRGLALTSGGPGSPLGGAAEATGHGASPGLGLGGPGVREELPKGGGGLEISDLCEFIQSAELLKLSPYVVGTHTKQAKETNNLCPMSQL